MTRNPLFWVALALLALGLAAPHEPGPAVLAPRPGMGTTIDVPQRPSASPSERLQQ